MELRQLAYFVAVAQEESFTRAAERLHVAQPGISQQVRRLEAELGEELVDRATKPVRLTPAGQAFLSHARDALDATDAGRAALAGLRGVVAGRLSLGIIPGIPHIDVAGLLATFHGRHPHVDVTLREEHPVALVAHLRRGDYDAVLVGLSDPSPPEGLGLEPISVEPLVLVTAPGHRLAHRASAAVAQLRDEAFVTLTRGSSLRTHLEDACRAAGFEARIALETSDVRLLSDLVARGLGVTIVPRALADLGAAGRTLVIIDIRPALTRRHVALAWTTARPQRPATEAFLACARAWLDDQAAVVRQAVGMTPAEPAPA
ncbi:MAG TPA: LysR substrate-binding domain-containing protein [Acidimicrobiales bacterium]|nr:LysR substrate-binding domain-containing protein [Acidimicrobiales bacterium]